VQQPTQPLERVGEFTGGRRKEAIKSNFQDILSDEKGTRVHRSVTRGGGRLRFADHQIAMCAKRGQEKVLKQNGAGTDDVLTVKGKSPTNPRAQGTKREGIEHGKAGRLEVNFLGQLAQSDRGICNVHVRSGDEREEQKEKGVVAASGIVTSETVERGHAEMQHWQGRGSQAENRMKRNDVNAGRWVGYTRRRSGDSRL